MLLTSFVGGPKEKALALIDLEKNSVDFLDNPTGSKGIAGIVKYPNGYAMCGELDSLHAIIVLMNGEFGLEQIFETKLIRGPHDIIFDEDHFLVASSGTNEIIKLDLDVVNNKIVEERLFYTHSSDNYDVYHLNSLAINKYGDVYFSVFGKRETPQQWGLMKYGTIYSISKCGIVTDIGRKNIETYFHPHSLQFIDDELHFCESHRFRFRNIEDKLFTYRLDGYTRGLASDNKNYYVGVSASRNISKSTGEPNETIINSVNCGIWSIAKDSSNMIKLDLSEEGVKEIYDILII